MQILEVRSMRVLVAMSLALLFSAGVFSQDEAPAPGSDDTEVAEQVQPDQEVEVNEDNYRQFMELKDGLRQRTVAPQESFESRSGLQKLDDLPEASQKHLRNQLREIISSGDRWQPGDENTEHPYVPSEAARTNASLQKQEAEAWGELLDNYHAREAQIYANSARTRAAMAGSAAAMGGKNTESGGQGENRTGQSRQGSDGSASRPGSEADSFAPGAQGGADAQEPEGVAQSAMEFLQKAGYQGGSANADAAQQQAGDSGQMSDQTQQGAQQATTQTDAQRMSTNPAAQAASQAQSTEGTEQNAMEFLQQLGQQQDGTADSGAQQAGDNSESGAADKQEDSVGTDLQDVTIAAAASGSAEPPEEGVSQNALEYLSGEGSSGENTCLLYTSDAADDRT